MKVMDTQSYLMSMGWAGPGHPLHPSAYKQKGHRGLAYDPNDVRTTSTGNGLIKPLLVSRKDNNLGLGRRAHEPQAGNEWWLKGFEKALGDIGKSESERSSGVSTPVYEGKHGGLYSFFVRGERVEGSIGEDGQMRMKKRKSDALDDEEEEEEEEKEASKEFEQVATFLAVRDQVQRRHRRAKSTPQEEFQQAGEYFAARDGKAKKERKSEPEALLEVDNMETKQTRETKSKKKPRSEVGRELDDQPSDVLETKEERRERRRKRKEAKEVSRVTLTSPATEAIEAADKATRNEEKRRRKSENNNS